MHSDSTQERAIAYLLGELSDSDSAQFEREMALDPDLATLVDELEESMSLGILADTESKEPSAQLEDRIVSQLPERERKTEEEGPAPKRSKIVPFLAIGGWAAAACFVFLYFASQSELETMEQQAISLQQEQATVSEELEAVMNALADVRGERNELATTVAELQRQKALDQVQIASLTSELDTLYQGIAVWDSERDEGIVRVYNLPALDQARQDYQMWVITGDSPNPISAGVFQVDQNGQAEYRFSPLTAIEEIMAFAISREAKGGASSPEGPILLTGRP